MKRKFFPLLKVGSGDEFGVLSWQVWLKAVKLAPDGAFIDGDFSERSWLATFLKDFQDKKGLKKTGDLDSRTLDALSELAGYDMSLVEVSVFAEVEPANVEATTGRTTNVFAFKEHLSHQA